MTERKAARPGARNHARKGEIVALAGVTIEPPAHLLFYNDMERAYFDRLLAYRAPDDWKLADFDRLKLATENWWRVQVECEILDTEDTVLIDENGKAFVNPRLRVIDIYQKTHDSLLRGLGVARPNMKPEILAKRREDVEAARRSIVPDRLLSQTRGALSVVNGGKKAK